MDREASKFGERLDYALRTLNLSRGRLAMLLGVNKSLTSRWANGVCRPSGHSFERLTGLIADQAPGFNQVSWDLSESDFKSLFASQASVRSGAMVEPADRLKALRAAGADDLARVIDVYCGVYAVFHGFATAPGTVAVYLCVIWREGHRMLMRFHYPPRPFVGEVISVQQHLFTTMCIEGGEAGVFAGFMNPVVGRRALLLDGVWITLAWDGSQTPTCSRGIGVRLAELEAEREPPASAWQDAVWGRMTATMLEGELERLMGPRLVVSLRPRAVDPLIGGLAKVAAPKSANRSVSECNVTPDLARDIERIREAFLPLRPIRKDRRRLLS